MRSSARKTGPICQIHLSFFHVNLFSCVGYTISVSFIEFLRKFLIKYYIKKELLNLKGLKLGQIFMCRQDRPTNLVKNKRLDQIGTCVKLTGQHHNTYTVGGSNKGFLRPSRWTFYIGEFIGALMACTVTTWN